MALIGALHGIGALVLLGLGYAVVLRPKTRKAGHVRLGRAYARLSFPILVTGFVVGLRHWPVLTPFQLIVPPTFAATAVGWWAATRRGRARLGPVWIHVHIASMGGTVIAWSTGFAFQLVDHAGLDLRDPKVTITTFVIPTLVGTPIIERAIRTRSRPTRGGQQIVERVVAVAEG